MMSFFRCKLKAQTLTLAAFIAYLLITLSSYAEARPDQKLHAGGWHGYKVFESSGRVPLVCYLYGPKDRKVFLGVRMMNDGSKGLLLQSDNWSLPTGDVYDLTISFDNSERVTVKAEALGSSTLHIYVPPGGSLERIFRKSHELTIAAARAVYYFQLNGSARAMSTVTQCFQRPKPTRRPPPSSPEGSSNNPFGEGTAPPSDGGSDNPFGNAVPDSDDGDDKAPYIPPGRRNDVKLDLGSQRFLG